MGRKVAKNAQEDYNEPFDIRLIQHPYVHC